MASDRLFIAICLDQMIREKLHKQLEPLRRQVKEVKWVRSEQAHFTLAFLGNIEQEKQEAIKKVCQETTSSHQSFGLKLSIPGAFPNDNHPQVLWVGMDQGQIEMELLAQTLHTQLEAIGIELEKRVFIPHLTVGRVRSHKKLKHWQEIKKQLTLQQACMDVHSLTLIRSTLTPTGSVYNNLATFSLQHV